MFQVVHNWCLHLDAAILKDSLCNVSLDETLHHASLGVEAHVPGVRRGFVVSDPEFLHETHVRGNLLNGSNLCRLVIFQTLQILVVRKIKLCDRSEVPISDRL